MVMNITYMKVSWLSIKPHSDSPSRSLVEFLCLLLLLLGSDVEVNPGPSDQFKNLSIVQMNVQSLYMVSENNPYVKLNELNTTFAIEKEVDVICITETWLHSGIDDDKLMITGYKKPYRRDRTDNRYGGVCAYISDKLTSERLIDLEPDDIELIWIEIKVQLKKFWLESAIGPQVKTVMKLINSWTDYTYPYLMP